LAKIESDCDVGTNAPSNDLGIVAAGFKFAFYSKKVDQAARLYRSRAASVLLFFLPAFLPTSVAAIGQFNPGEGRILVHGYITGMNGQPVNLATVEMRDLRGVKMGTSLTDNAGSFAISTFAEPGEYVLLAAKQAQISDERITLDQADVEVTIALPAASAVVGSQRREDYAVSVQQLRTSEKVRMHLKLANQQFGKLNIAGAEQEVERALQIDDSCAAEYSMRAFLRIASRNFNGAIDDAKRAELLDPFDADAYLAMATAYNSLAQFQSAEEASRQALRIHSDLWQAQLELAKALQGQGRFVLAWRELDELSKDFPDVHLVRANVLVGLARQREAAEEFSRFLQEAPEDPRNQQVQRIVARLAGP
jgi:tetratricopeptide (TPR) repeat protein